jgi:predicted dehydrogenase
MRVAIIGDTGNGNYGHQIDCGVAQARNLSVCAVADPDDEGRIEAMRRLAVDRGYSDYRKLLREERPDIVAVAPRHPTKHLEMVTAALRAGCHVYCEKPLAVELREADAIVALARDAGLRVAVALPFVHEARYRQMLELIANGAVGRILHLRAFTKCDHRGGGQDMAVLGPHLFDMMRRFGGEPISCTASIYVGGTAANRGDIRIGDEGVGPIVGDRIHASFTFTGGITGTIESTRVDGLEPAKQPYRLEIYGERGALAARAPYADHGVWFAPRPFGAPPDGAWTALETSGASSQAAYHAPALVDLVAAIAERRDPLASALDGLRALEMSHAMYASHFTGGTVTFPLGQRSHPLGGLVPP